MVCAWRCGIRVHLHISIFHICIATVHTSNLACLQCTCVCIAGAASYHGNSILSVMSRKPIELAGFCHTFSNMAHQLLLSKKELTSWTQGTCSTNPSSSPLSYRW